MFLKTYRYTKALNSLHKPLAAEKHVLDRQLLQVAVNRETALYIKGICGITIIFKSERNIVN